MQYHAQNLIDSSADSSSITLFLLHATKKVCAFRLISTSKLICNAKRSI